MFEGRIERTCLVIIAAVIIVLILQELQSIFIPLTFALFLSFIFAPINSALYKKKIPKPLIMTIMLITLLLTFLVIGLVFYFGISSVVTQFPKYNQMINENISQIITSAQNLLTRFEVYFDKAPQWLNLKDLIPVSQFQISRVITGTVGPFVDFFVKLALTLIFLLFIVAGKDRLEQRIKKVLSETRNKQTLSVVENIKDQMKRYFFQKTLISLGTALAGMFFVWIFGVDFVIISGIFFFFLNFIPNIGSIVASVFPISISLLQYGLSTRSFFLALFIVSTQLSFGNIIEPKVMGERLNLSPVVILASLIFWGWLWGIVGMFLAVPITSIISIIIKEIPSMNVVSAIISDD